MSSSPACHAVTLCLWRPPDHKALLQAYTDLAMYYSSSGMHSHVFFAAASMWSVCKRLSSKVCGSGEAKTYYNHAMKCANPLCSCWEGSMHLFWGFFVLLRFVIHVVALLSACRKTQQQLAISSSEL